MIILIFLLRFVENTFIHLIQQGYMCHSATQLKFPNGMRYKVHATTQLKFPNGMRYKGVTQR